jgi:hypothetical protein
MDRIKEILVELADEETAEIQQPASMKDIEQCQKVLAANGLPVLPQGYIDFLHQCNGFVWGLKFFGTKSFPSSDPDSDSIRKDIVAANKAFIKGSGNLPHLKHRLLIGEGSEEYYVYNAQKNQYETLSEAYQLWDEYDTFEALFFEACELEED